MQGITKKEDLEEERTKRHVLRQQSPNSVLRNITLQGVSKFVSAVNAIK